MLLDLPILRARNVLEPWTPANGKKNLAVSYPDPIPEMYLQCIVVARVDCCVSYLPLVRGSVLVKVTCFGKRFFSPHPFLSPGARLHLCKGAADKCFEVARLRGEKYSWPFVQ